MNRTLSFKLALCLLLSGIGFLGNWFRVELFFNVDFLAGSIFVMLAILSLGGLYGVTAGFIAATCTFFLWNHPWAIVIMTGEAIFVDWLYAKRNGNVVIYDMLYWAVIGIPLVYIFYHAVMGIEMQTTLLIMLKQAMNGIVNALMASLAYLLIETRKDSIKDGVPFSKLIFTVMASMVLVPAMIFFVIVMRTFFEKEKAAVAETVSYSSEIARLNLTNRIDEHLSVIQSLSHLAGNLDTTDSSAMQHLVETIQAGAPVFYRMGVLNRDSITVAYFPMEIDGKPTRGVDFSDRPYIPILKEKMQPYIPDVVMGKLGRPVPIALLLAPIVVAGEYKGYVSGVIDISKMPDVLTRLVGRNNLNITLADGKWQVISSSVSDLKTMAPFVRPYHGEGMGIQIGKAFHWVPEPRPGTSIMQRWRDSLLIKAVALSPNYGWKVIVEASFLPVVEHMSRFSIYGLSLLMLLTIVVVGLCRLLSSAFVSTVTRLQDITQSLPEQMEGIEKINWPQTHIRELAALSKGFHDMALALNNAFREMVHLTESLEQKVQERTAALQEQHQVIGAIFDASPGLLMLKDRQSVYRAVNPAFCRFLGKTQGEIIGKTDYDLFPPEEAQAYSTDDATMMATGQMKSGDQSVTGAIGRRWLHVTETPIHDGAGEPAGILISALDVTERRKWEEGQRQLVKAESLGRMAGAVAHHFNNKLMAVLGNLELALYDLGPGNAAAEVLGEAHRAAEQAADMSRLMLSYLGQAIAKVEPMDLVQACRNLIADQSGFLPEQIILETDICPEKLIIRGNEAKVRQVLENLITNAREAIGENSGNIRVCIMAVQAGETASRRIFPVGWKPKIDFYACMEVSDTGSGITPEQLDCIFDPFFTTKFTGRGLGLAVSLGTVRQCNGAIAVRSRPHGGSTFRVFWPLESREPAPATEVEPETPKAGTLSGLVLLVDDDPQVRSMARDMLGRMGCDVLAAADGMEALDTFLAHRDEIRIVLLDLTMPGMDGWKTLAAIRAVRPDTPIILASGYDEAQAMEGGKDERPQAFLHKPYKMIELRAALAMALGSARKDTTKNSTALRPEKNSDDQS